jgi:hypothetical protein
MVVLTIPLSYVFKIKTQSALKCFKNTLCDGRVSCKRPLGDCDYRTDGKYPTTEISPDF